MKKAQSDDREELSVVYSYLKILTLTGGLAITSLTLIGHTLISRFRENHSHQMAAKQPVPATPISPVAEQLKPGIPKSEPIITENQLVAKPINEYAAIDIQEQKAEIPQNAKPEIVGQDHPDSPQDSALASIVTEAVPPAQIDVFPAGYGTFRILIESNANDQFTATLTDMLHQEIVAEEYEVVQGKNEFLLDSGEIPRGDYVLKVSNGIITSQKRVTLK